MKLVILSGILFLASCALPPTRTPSGEKIESGTNTVILASSDNAEKFFRELKLRALEKDYYFLETDSNPYSFVTEFQDLSKKVSVQLKVYIRELPNGSNAVVTGRYIKLKKIKEGFDPRPKRIKESGGGSSAVDQAWRALHDYAVGSEEWKYKFVKVKR